MISDLRGSGSRAPSRACSRAARARAARGTRSGPGTITPVGRDERVDRQQAERRRRVDEDVVVAILDRRERLLERALAADLARERHVGAGEVDRRDRDVDLARARSPARSGAGARARRTSTARSCRGSGPGTSSGCPAGRGRSRARDSPARRTRRRGSASSSSSRRRPSGSRARSPSPRQPQARSWDERWDAEAGARDPSVVRSSGWSRTFLPFVFEVPRRPRAPARRPRRAPSLGLVDERPQLVEQLGGRCARPLEPLEALESVEHPCSRSIRRP